MDNQDHHKPKETVRFVDKLNPRTYDVDPLRVFKQLFGKEAEIDDVSGIIINLVPNATTGR